MVKELSQLLEFIRTQLPLKDEDVAHLLPHIKLTEYNRKETILGLDETCSGVFYVVEGLFRIFTIKDGNEVNMSFMSENEFFADYESLMTGANCQCEVQAIEKTTLLFLPYDKLIEAYDKSHMLERLGRMLVERAFVKYLSQNHSKSSLKLEQKYAEFEQDHKELVNRIPLKHLASFFRITPESLSRIRKTRFQSIS